MIPEFGGGNYSRGFVYLRGILFMGHLFLGQLYLLSGGGESGKFATF